MLPRCRPAALPEHRGEADALPARGREGSPLRRAHSRIEDPPRCSAKTHVARRSAGSCCPSLADTPSLSTAPDRSPARLRPRSQVGADFRIAQVNPIALPVLGHIPDLIGGDFDPMIHTQLEQCDVIGGTHASAT
jgi:hypothetical protein